MPSIISLSFFISDINIPNIGNAATDEKVNSYITIFEPKILEDVLGYELYTAFIAGKSSVQRMMDLLNGVNYIDLKGKSQRYKGIVYSNRSFIAQYVYFNIIKNDQTLTTGIGQVQVKGKETTPVLPTDKLINAWNFIADEVNSIISFLWTRNKQANIYSEIDECQMQNALNKFSKINFFGI